MGTCYVVVLMGCLVAAALEPCGAQTVPVLSVDFDQTTSNGFTSNEGIEFEVNDGQDVNITPSGSAGVLELDGETYYTASDLDPRCLTDNDRCNCMSSANSCESEEDANGFTFSFWVNPYERTADPKGAMNVMQFGFGTDEEFGLKVQYRRALFIINMQGRTVEKKVKCKIPKDVWERKDENGKPVKVHVSGKKRPFEDAPLFMTFNGRGFSQNNVEFENVENSLDCTVRAKTRSADNQVSVVNNTIIIGGAYNTDDEVVNRLFTGAIWGVRFYNQNLNISTIRDIMEETDI